MSDPVHQQYEAYPYPARDPAQERERLVAGSPSHLAEINHYVLGGRLDLARGFRVLVAGGGTGDGTIMLAQHLADAARNWDGPNPSWEIVYLDLSRASRRIAEARARERGLTHVTFHTGSLFDLPRLDLGRFDYIDCCGVLHHLEDPPAGLRALTEVLADDGGIGLMVYAPYGRTGVYQVQNMLRALSHGLPLSEQIGLARRLLEALPATNWFQRNTHVGDHRKSEAELVDLLLHSRDRAYRVAEVVELIDRAGLRPVTFLEPARYDPATYFSDGRLLRKLGELDWLARAAFAEEAAGNMKAHVIYAVKAANRADTVARPEGPEAVPVLRQIEGAALSRAVAPDLTLKVDLDGIKLRRVLPRLAPALLARIDGQASLGEIHAALRAFDARLDWAAFKAQFDRLYEILNGFNHLLIRFRSAP